MRCIWLLSWCISVFLIITLSKNCEGYPELSGDSNSSFSQTLNLSNRSDCENSGAVSETNDNSKPKLQDICLTPACDKAAKRMLKYMDPKVKPCQNFYKFACGNFLKSEVIPDNKIEVHSFSNLLNKIDEQLKNDIEQKIQPDEPKPFTMAKNLYQYCMNTTAIEEKGLKTILDILKELGGWPVLEGDLWQEEHFDWKQSVYKSRKLGLSIDNFFAFHIGVDSKNNTKRVIKIDEALLPLNREYLIMGLKYKIVKAYYRYMVDIAVIFGADKAKARRELLESLEFELKLTNIALIQEQNRNSTAFYNPMTLKDLQGNYTTIPWKEYINSILQPHAEVDEDEVVIVKVPAYLKQFEILMEQTPKRIQANYAMWRVVFESVDFLTAKLRERHLNFSNVTHRIIERPSRWKECLSVTSEMMGEIVGALYIRKYFNEESKESVVEMVNSIQQEFKKILQEVYWMDNKTKMIALEKAEAMSSFIAYPDELLNDKELEKVYKNLEITPNDYHQTMLNIMVFWREYSIREFRKPVNKSDWLEWPFPAAVNAYYALDANRFMLPAGILQGIFFNKDVPRYMNYAGIGSIIGHEIAHAFDDQGRQFDKEGNLVDWWEPETKERYLKKAECFIHQYGNYSAEEVGLNLNGINTLGENIADNGGIKASYLAYQESVKLNGPEPRLRGLDYSPSQLFWINGAQIWCTKYRTEHLKLEIENNVHSLAEFRVLGSLSNMPKFSRDFSCPIGSKMNPKKKCSVC